MYPRSGFRSGGTSTKTTLLETTLLSTPEKGNACKEAEGYSRDSWPSRGFPGIRCDFSYVPFLLPRERASSSSSGSSTHSALRQAASPMSVFLLSSEMVQKSSSSKAGAISATQWRSSLLKSTLKPPAGAAEDAEAPRDRLVVYDHRLLWLLLRPCQSRLPEKCPCLVWGGVSTSRWAVLARQEASITRFGLFRPKFGQKMRKMITSHE